MPKPLLRAALLLILPLAATAQNIETLLVSGERLPSSLKDFNGSASVLGGDRLSQDFQQHIQQSLNQAPGVNLQRGEGQEYLPALRSAVLTGAGACGSLLTQQDGIGLRAQGFCNINELFDANSETAARIEVLRGPGNALYGSNALHGVINLVTPALAGTQPNRIELLAGPNDYAQARMQWGESGAYGVNMTLAHDGGYRDQSGFGQQKLDAYRVQQLGDWQATHAVALMNLNQETAGYISGLGSYRDETAVRSNPNPEAYRDPWSIRAYSRWQNETANLLLTPYVRLNRMNFLQHFLPGTPLEQNGHGSIGLQSLKQLPYSQGLLSFGLDLELTNGWLRQAQDQPTTGSAFLVATVPNGKHYDYQVDASQLAPFVQLRHRLSEQLELHTGVRLEQVRYQYDNRMLAGRTRDDGTACGFGGCRYSRPADRSDRFENASFNLGLNWSLGDSTALYARIASGYRAPQASELYRLRGAQQVADIHSESMRSAELGWRYYQGGTNLELALYRMQKNDVIFRDSNDFYVSDGKTSHQGAELSLQGALMAQWSYALVLNQALHKYEDSFDSGGGSLDGRRIEAAPEWFGQASLAWQRANNRVELGLSYTGNYYLDAQNQFSYPGHSLLDVSWARETSWGQVSVALNNLLDKAYADRADYSIFSGPRYFPGEPRSLFVSIRRDF